MTAQLRQLRAVAAMPDITVQVLPAVAHPANAGGFVIADDSAWCEHVAGGFVYTDQTVRALLRLFDTVRSESYRASETAALLERTAQTLGLWRKSTYSDANGGYCIEVASANVVTVRDTNDRDGIMLAVPLAAWLIFVAS